MVASKGILRQNHRGHGICLCVFVLAGVPGILWVIKCAYCIYLLTAANACSSCCPVRIIGAFFLDAQKCQASKVKLAELFGA